jgi:uncharacterized membrane protein
MIFKNIPLLKTFTWRMIATTTSITIAYFITGSFEIGFTIGVIETIVKSLLYFLHEKYWEKNIKRN